VNEARGEHAAGVIGVVVAGVLASAIVPGPYSLGSTLVGVTLLGLLFGYCDLPHPAALREAIGFAAAVAFALLLTFGFVAEALGWHISGWKPHSTINHYESRVGQDWTDGGLALMAWFGLFVVVLLLLLVRLVAYLRRIAPDAVREGGVTPSNDTGEPPTAEIGAQPREATLEDELLVTTDPHITPDDDATSR
jgi:hypothetical protein